MIISSDSMMQRFGEMVGARLVGGEVFELVGDVGAGKTTFVRGLAKGLGVSEQVQSPTFTISREYHCRDDLRLVHYDFYRLNEAGLMADELAESIGDKKSIVVIEWSGVASDQLPVGRIAIEILPVPGDESAREVRVSASGVLESIVKEVFDVLAN